MKVDIYRSQHDGSKFHIHPDGSRCDHCYADPLESEVEMPDAVYRALRDKFTTRGYAVVPRDVAISEAAIDWWSVVSLLIPA